jgi:hypothetical protein
MHRKTASFVAVTSVAAALFLAPSALGADPAASLIASSGNTTQSATVDPVNVSTGGDPDATVATGSRGAATGSASTDDTAASAEVRCVSAGAASGETSADGARAHPVTRTRRRSSAPRTSRPSPEPSGAFRQTAPAQTRARAGPSGHVPQTEPMPQLPRARQKRLRRAEPSAASAPAVPVPTRAQAARSDLARMNLEWAGPAGRGRTRPQAAAGPAPSEDKRKVAKAAPWRASRAPSFRTPAFPYGSLRSLASLPWAQASS